ncbi:hypothetical protein [Microbacterium sp. NPDC055455]
MSKMYADKVAFIVTTPERRATWGTTPEQVDRAIRAARRQVQRYGDDAKMGLLSWCGDDTERALLERALSPNVRVSTVVKEWDTRTR